MKGNDLTHLIRSHSSHDDGYRLHFAGRCITICSYLTLPMVAFLDPGKKLKSRSKEVKDVPATIRLTELDISEEPKTGTAKNTGA